MTTRTVTTAAIQHIIENTLSFQDVIAHTEKGEKMRLIDADSLKDFIDCGHLRPPTELCFSELDVCNIIDKRTTIEMPSWIPCSERLPEVSGKYLVTVKWSNDNENEHIYITTSWYKEWDDVGWDWSEFNVIAWRPLPEPYKEK